MKIKHLMIVGLILAIITIGAASATEDADALAVEDSTDTIDSVENEKTIDSSPGDANVLSDGEDDEYEDEYDYWDSHNPITTPNGYVEYGSDENITFEILSDAQGTLKVWENEYSYDNEIEDYIVSGYKFNKTIEIVNGKGVIPLKELSVGQHNLNLEYTGDYEDYVRYSLSEYLDEDMIKITIYPFIIKQRVWTEEDLIVKFAMPSGIIANVSVYDNDRDWNAKSIANASASDGQINLGKFEEGYYRLYFYFLNESGSVFDSDYFDVSFEALSENSDWEIEVAPINVINAPYQYIHISNMGSQNGEFELYIDGKKVDEVFYDEDLQFDASDLSVGNHTFKITYSGDDYFKPANKTGNFNVTNVVIDIPEKYDMVNNYYDEAIIIKMSKDATGRIIVKANGTVIFDEAIVNEDNDDYFAIEVSLFDLKSGINDVEVNVTGKYSASKTGKINATYYLEFNNEGQINYGDKELALVGPRDLAGDIYVTIDGVEYLAKKVDDEDYIEHIVEIPANISVGTQVSKIRYAGDNKYSAQEFNDNLTVNIRFNVPYDTEEGSEISLLLPENATGNLSVTIYKKVNGIPVLVMDRNITLIKGNASVSLKDFPYGKYTVYLNYTGSDYHLDAKEGEFTINPDIMAPSKMIEGDNKFISVNVPGWNGTFTIEYWVEDWEVVKSVQLKDGKASISLSELPSDVTSITWYLYNTYIIHNEEEGDSENEDDYSGYVYLSIQKPIIKAGNANVIYTDGSLYKVQITGIDKDLIVAGDTVTFKIANKVIGTGKLDKNGYASVKITQIPGSYKITVQYKKASVTKTLTVKHVLKLQKVKVKRSAKKLVIKATLSKVNGKYLKNKKITLKFNGKKLTAKTDKKGVAKFTVKKSILKKLKKGKKVKYQATYLKDTVKYTVKVK